MALFRRFFYRKPPDRLLEISERVYVFDCCFSTDVLEEDEFKIYVRGVIAQLQDYYPDASFMVFNFREGERRSQISDLLSQYDMTVMEYPRQYLGCPLLPMEMVNHFLSSSENWLTLEGQQNVLLMHCETGGWPVLAFMLAGFLLYRGQYTGELKTLEMIYKQAPKQLLHILSPLNPQPSQLRYLQYISRRNLGLDWPPSDTPLTLDCIILRVLPLFNGGRGYQPIIRVYGHDPSSTPANRTSKLLFSSSKTKKEARHYQQDECAFVKIDIHHRVQGDVVLECIHLDNDLVREEMMFRVMFHTAFVRSNVLMLSQGEVDVLWDSKDQVPKDFKAEVLFSDADAVPSEDGSETEPEEFFEVEEIFSNAVDGKADLDADIVQDQIIQESKLNDDNYKDCAPEDRKMNAINLKNSKADPDSTIVVADVSGNRGINVVIKDVSGTSKKKENKQDRDDSSLQTKLERQDSHPNLSVDTTREKSEKPHLPSMKKHSTVNSKSDADSVVKGQITKEHEPLERSPFANSTDASYPPSRDNNGAPELAISEDLQLTITKKLKAFATTSFYPLVSTDDTPEPISYALDDKESAVCAPLKQTSCPPLLTSTAVDLIAHQVLPLPPPPPKPPSFNTSSNVISMQQNSTILQAVLHPAEPRSRTPSSSLSSLAPMLPPASLRETPQLTPSPDSQTEPLLTSSSLQNVGTVLPPPPPPPPPPWMPQLQLCHM
ncbi:hypothetical protein LguiA_009623 [Lonicera macranthoides]